MATHVFLTAQSQTLNSCDSSQSCNISRLSAYIGLPLLDFLVMHWF